MKLKDFDFRIWDKNYTGCDNKNCKCQSNFIYGEEAKIRLSEFNNDAEIELWTGYFDKNGNKIYENDILEYEPLEELYHITRDNTYKMFKIEIFSKNFNNKIYKRKAEPDISFL
ncbi:hypothetical protein HEJ39_002084, partial [Campylobacter jejuni]|nr:hypothetical protein [Campylobacter jejuni]